MEYPWGETDLISDLPRASLHEDHGSAHSSGYSSLDSEQTRRAYESEEGACITLAPGQTLNGTGFSIKDLKEIATNSCNATRFRVHFKWLPESLNQAQELQPSFLSVTLEPQDITRWRMAWRAVEKYDRLDGHLCRRSKDMPDISDIFEQNRLMFGFSITAVVYGGLHALAWFAQFSSSTEQILWRISAATVMGGFPVARGLDRLDGITSNILETLIVTLLNLILLAYILARAYLVVECFISLSHLPAGVYDVPQWSSYFPHIA